MKNTLTATIYQCPNTQDRYMVNLAYLSRNYVVTTNELWGMRLNVKMWTRSFCMAHKMVMPSKTELIYDVCLTDVLMEYEFNGGAGT